jgi:germination protein M
MKRIICLVLAVMILTTGCSFLGHKGEQEQIIPAADQSINASDAASNTQAANTSTAKNTQGAAASSTGAAPFTSSSLASSGSDEQTGGLLIDNGTGKGVSSADDKSSLLLTLYYKNKEGLIVPVTRKVQKQEGLAKAAISGLIDDAVTREQLDYYGLSPVLPKGTKIKGINIKDKVAVIDFSKDFLNFSSKQDEQSAVSSIVYTLTGFTTVSDVKIRVEGKEMSTLKNGTDLSVLRNRNNTLVNAGDTELKDGCIKWDAYYVADGSNNINYLVPVSIQVPQSDLNGVPGLIFDELSKNPGDSAYFTSIPQGTKLLSFGQQGSTAVLDFSGDITKYGGSAKEDSLLDQIYYTISQMKGIQKVKILVDGKEKAFPEGTEVASAKNIPLTFNKVIEK